MYSPDGKKIAYWSDVSGEYELTLYDTEKSTSKKVTNLGPGYRYEIHWSPDTKHIAYVDQTMNINICNTESGENKVISPMPGKVVQVLVSEGDVVKEGETVVIISAMKMESEYKVKKDRTIKEIKVKEGDTITANQLKTKGVSAIQKNLLENQEVVITIRGKEKFVVMDMKQYNYLRECELDAALHEARADYDSGRYVTESVEDHIERITK